MIYKKSDFSKCVFSPLTDGRMLESYPVLNEILNPDWLDDTTDQILRYVIALYDPASPLLRNEKDFVHRRDIAMQVAVIEDEDLRVQVCSHTHNYLAELVVKYLQRFAKSKEFAAICAMEYTFWESVQELFKPISGKDTKQVLESVQKKSAIKDEIDKDIDRLELYYKKFFSGDEELEKRAKSKFKPEDINKMLQQ